MQWFDEIFDSQFSRKVRRCCRLIGQKHLQFRNWLLDPVNKRSIGEKKTTAVIRLCRKMKAGIKYETSNV